MSIALFNKNPHLKKIISKYMDNGENISEFKLRHLHFLLQKHNHTISSVKPSYAQFKSFKELYNAILIITNHGYKHRFSDDFSKNDLLIYCDENKVEYKILDNSVVRVKIETFEQMQDLGSRHWCIQRSYKDFMKYTQDSDQFIFFSFDKQAYADYRLGATLGKKNLVFNDNNENVTTYLLAEDINTTNQNENHQNDLYDQLFKIPGMMPNFITIEYFILFFAFSILGIVFNYTGNIGVQAVIDSSGNSNIIFDLSDVLGVLCAFFYGVMALRIYFCFSIVFKCIRNHTFNTDVYPFLTYMSLYVFVGGGTFSYIAYTTLKAMS